MLFLSHPEPGTFFGKVLGVLSSVIVILPYSEVLGIPALIFVPIQASTGEIFHRFEIEYDLKSLL
jgi:hypothetical protein